MRNLTKRIGGIFLSLVVGLGGFPTYAGAGLIGTGQSIDAEQHQERVERVQSFLARDDVARALEQHGVDPAEAQARVASLTEAELARLDARIDDMPAGAGVVEVLGIVFIVLLVLELLGVTDVFTGT